MGYISYEYRGIVDRVVDSDTVDATIDVGFGITVKHRFRIDGFDAPETWRPRNEAEKRHGEAATHRALELLLEEDNLIFVTSKTPGIYGRYGAQIFLEDERDYAEVMIQEGFAKQDVY